MFQQNLVKNKLSKYNTNFDSRTLTTNSFLASPSFQQYKLFRSEANEMKQHQNSIEEAPINYQTLISQKYDARRFKYFMKILLVVDNIIIEEKLPKEIAKELKDHPKKCFSFREDEVKPRFPDLFFDDIYSTHSLLNTTNHTFDLLSAIAINVVQSNTQTSKIDISVKSMEALDFGSLTDDQIRELVSRKMKKLDRFNNALVMKDMKVSHLYEKLNEKQLYAFCRFQKRMKQLIMRKKLIKAIKMNEFFEQKKNYLKLKKSIKAHQDRIKGLTGSSIFDSTVDFAGKII